MEWQIRKQLEQQDLEHRIAVCQNTPVTNPNNFPFIIEQYSFRPDQTIYVVRDDLICGGTKSRAAYEFLKENRQYQEYVYITPWYGGAQIALPWLLKVLEQEDGIKRQATIVMDTYLAGLLEEPPVSKLPPYTALAKFYGANIIELNPSIEKFAWAEKYCRDNQALFIEPGFNYPQVMDKIASLSQQIKSQYGRFDECWSAVGSGTLIRGLQAADLANSYHGVCIFEQCPPIGQAE
jgi:hypothetical protein